MILLDLSQICISNIFMNIKNLKRVNEELEEHEFPGMPGTKMPLNEDLIRHMILNSIRMYRTKFKNKFGEIVICVDNRHYWRKEVFPQYKGDRRQKREDSVLDWNLIFDCINKIKVELREYFPYKVIEVTGAEADDITAVIAKREYKAEKILILSGDEDFLQLQKYPNVSQYAPVKKQFLISKNPIEDLRAHIMVAGDDGIPNFRSADDSKVNHIRQITIRKDDLVRWIKESNPENFCDIKMLHGYKRNQQLIDFDFIPIEIQKKIIDEWEKPFEIDRKKLVPYFIKYQLVELMDKIQEF